MGIPQPPLEWPDHPDWQKRAACRTSRTPEKWFPERGQDAEPAKAVCRRCPVRGECRRFALANRFMWGVWGGLSEQERRDITERRKPVMADLDPEITDVLPAAERLVQAVHDLDPDATAAVLDQAGDQLPTLVITLAAMLPPDTDLVLLLGWLANPDEYDRLRAAGVPASAAVVLADVEVRRAS